MLPTSIPDFAIDTQPVYSTTFSILSLLMTLTMMAITPYMVIHTHNAIPTAATALPERGSHPMLGIDYTGSYWLHADGEWERVLSINMKERFAHLYVDRSERVLVVSADPRRQYGDILGILEAAQAASVSRISLLVECPIGKETLRERCRA